MSLSSHFLDVQDLSVKFPIYSGIFSKIKNYFSAVNHVSFYLKEGETLGIVGESGSGKTTIARALVKLIKPTSGQIFFRGKEIVQMSERQFRPLRKEIQYLFQDPFSSLNPKLSISSIITEALDIHFPNLNHTEKEDRVIDLLKQVNLPTDILQRYPSSCSGGQRQRIGIARALAVQPKLLICDEPVSSLDVSIQAQIINLLKDMQQKYQLSLIFISHDLAIVEHMSQRIMVILHGNIIESGSSDEIIHQPKHPYTQELLAAVPKIY